MLKSYYKYIYYIYLWLSFFSLSHSNYSFRYCCNDIIRFRNLSKILLYLSLSMIFDFSSIISPHFSLFTFFYFRFFLLKIAITKLVDVFFEYEFLDINVSGFDELSS